MFFIFTPIWGRFPFWLIFSRWVETTNQWLIDDLCVFYCDVFLSPESSKDEVAKLGDTLRIQSLGQWFHGGDMAALKPFPKEVHVTFTIMYDGFLCQQCPGSRYCRRHSGGWFKWALRLYVWQIYSVFVKISRKPVYLSGVFWFRHWPQRPGKPTNLPNSWRSKATGQYLRVKKDGTCQETQGGDTQLTAGFFHTVLKKLFGDQWFWVAKWYNIIYHEIAKWIWHYVYDMSMIVCI